MGQGEDPGSSNYSTNADFDGDGMNTWQEYVADTDPALSNSVLRLAGTYVPASSSNATGQIRFSFQASPSRYYQLEYSTNLSSSTIISNLGMGVTNMVITNNSPGIWYGGVRAWLAAP